MKNILANRFNYALLLITAVVMVLVTYGISFRSTGDDQYFLHLLTTGDSWSILKDRYLTWSGRVGVEYVLLETISHPVFWKITIPASIMIACYSLAVISGRHKHIGIFTAIAFILFLLMKKSVLSDSVFWVTGFYNYLLPASLALLTLAICSRSSQFPKITKIIPVISPLIYSYSEQIALSAILILLILIFFSKESDKKLCYIVLVITIVNFSICYLAPGSSSRAQTEAWSSFPDYLSLNIVQKASLGVYLLHTHLTDYKNNLYLILCIFCLFISIKNVRKGIPFILSSLFIFVHILLMFFVPKYHPDYISLSFRPEIFASIKPYIAILADLLCFLSILYTLALSRTNGLAVGLSLLVGCISVIAMGLSPTVFASGTRTMFVMDIAVIYAILSILPGVKSHAISNKESMN